MNTDEILERAKKTQPDLTAGDFVLLLDAEEEGNTAAAYAVSAADGLEELDVISFDLEEDGGMVECCRGNETLLGFETVNNRVREVDAAEDDARVVYLNTGRRSVVVEGGAVRPGTGGSIVPVSLAEALRACGYRS